MNRKEKVEVRLKERLAMAKEITKATAALSKLVEKMVEHDTETYKILNEPDCLFYDSPLSPNVTYRHIKDDMIKRDIDFIGVTFDGKPSLKHFDKWVQECEPWVLRYSGEVIEKKKGIDAII